MNTADWVSAVAGSHSMALACAAAGLLAAFGLGRLTLSSLKLEFRHPGVRDLSALALGLDILAFAAACLSLSKIPQLPANALIIAAIPLALYGICLAGKEISGTVSHFARMKCLPAALLLAPACLYLGAALCPPSGWDELVYQVATPFRWNASGVAGVSPDLPYTAFPSLPQLLYWPLIGGGGATAPKLLSFAVFLVMCAAVFLLCRRRASILASSALSFAFIAAPALTFLGKEAYAEQFIAFNMLCALLLPGGLKKGANVKAFIVCGILGGACAAVKLTGVFAALAIPLILALRRKTSFKSLALFAGIAAVFIAPFYLRPALATGNPLHPYFAGVFSHASETELASSQFHNAIGSARFGVDGLTGLLESPLLLSLPFKPFSDICDGSYGFQLLAFLLLGLLAFSLRRSEGETFKLGDYEIPAAILLLYLLWFFSGAKQARFLLPGFALACVLASFAMLSLDAKLKRFTAFALLALAIVSLPPNALKHSVISWRSVFAPAGQVNIVYSGTGAEYLPAIDAMLGLTPKDAKILLLFEERTLYIPRACEIGTPFFQAAHFTPPGNIDATLLKDALAKGSFTHVYMRAPENCPDLVKSYMDRCVPLVEAVAELERGGALKAVWSLAPAKLYEVRRSED